MSKLSDILDEGLACEARIDADDVRRARELEAENERLKSVLAEAERKLAATERQLASEQEELAWTIRSANGYAAKLMEVRAEADIGSYTEATRIRILNILDGDT